MKRILLSVMIILFVSTAYTQKHIGFDYFPYKEWVKTLKFNVLDINTEKKVVGFKHVYELQPSYYYGEEGEVTENPVDCGYAGMESMPRAGVVLGIFDLESQEYVKTFVIYESCFEKKNCYSYELSKQRLDSAKQIFTEYGLDFDQKITPITFTKNSESNQNLLETGGIKFSASFSNNYDYETTNSYLYADGKLIYDIEYEDNFAMASSADVWYEAAYKKNGMIVFLIKYFHTNHMEGPSSFEYHHFTPMFKITSGTVKQQ